MTETAKEFIKRKNIQFEKQKNSTVSMKDIGREGKHHFVREAWTFMPQHKREDKVFVIERLKKEKFDGKLAFGGKWKKGEIEYRIGYFIVGKIRNANGRWIWGQFCPMIPQKDMMKLINKAKKEKVLI